MSEAIRFLHALAQALSTMNLYSPGHPANKRGADTLWQALAALLAADEHPVFLFLGTAPVYDSRALHELRDWQYAQRLAAAGVQRLEFTREVTEESLTQLLARLMVRFTTGDAQGDEPVVPLPGIVFGAVTVQEDSGEGGITAGADAAIAESVSVELDLSDELDAMRFVQNAARQGSVARAEVEAVARLLCALADQLGLPQAAYDGTNERYHLVHPVNTALIVMAAARTAGIDAPGRHRLGVIALFHDIGMARIPAELADRDSLTPDQRRVVESHTVEGARLLLDRGGGGLELASLVAFEHHLRPDGNGYPARRFHPVPHWASRVVGSAAAFAALRAPRPYRPAWSRERALEYLDQGAGTVFDAESARLVLNTVGPA